MASIDEFRLASARERVLTGNLTAVFIALSIALTAFGLINAAAVAGGAWSASDEHPQNASTVR
jgi:hypothetical protein